MINRKYCVGLLRRYYHPQSKAPLSLTEREAVNNALYKLESRDKYLREEYDRLFTYYFAREGRNINAVSIEFCLSPNRIYARLAELCRLLDGELEMLEKYRYCTLKGLTNRDKTDIISIKKQ